MPGQDLDTATVTMLSPGEEPGTLVAGKYKILEIVGRGGMGVLTQE